MNSVKIEVQQKDHLRSTPQVVVNPSTTSNDRVNNIIDKINNCGDYEDLNQVLRKLLDDGDITQEGTEGNYDVYGINY